ncbi:hypothetical protein KHP62_02120 [Rhodobacteraceae bacterium NNCM2]|nr:hypothetical protein [Coraliihabitans acroporae]
MTGTDATATKAELEAIKAEIHAYPRPIAGCDAQFNHLLERRDILLKAVLRAQRDQTEAGT